MSQLTRQKIREQVRQARNEQSLEQQLHASNLLIDQIKQGVEFRAGMKVALYLSNDGEIETKAIIEYLWHNTISVYLPVLHPFANGYLIFVEYTIHSEMTTNKYGIAEPKLDCRFILPVSELDLVFMPLVAFDEDANRLGMGGGFYDRTFANKAERIQLIGLAHDCQKVDKLPLEVWDVPLDKIISPSYLIVSSIQVS